jgi:hypothetical protein
MTYPLLHCAALVLAVLTGYPVGTAIREWLHDRT